MELTYNGRISKDSMITYSDVPNIITFDNTSSTGSCNEIEFRLGSVGTFDNSKTYTITFDGHTIQGTKDKNKIGGLYYFLPTDSFDDRQYSAVTIVNAFNNIPAIQSNYKVHLVWNMNTMTPTASIKFTAREKYMEMPTYSCNWPSGYYAFGATNIGRPGDVMLDGESHIVNVDVWTYNYDDAFFDTEIEPTEFKYVTSLQKTYYGKPVSFDLSPVLTALLEKQNDMKLYLATMSCYSGGILKYSANTGYHYHTNGYECNFSDPYLMADKRAPRFAMNYKRGKGQGGSSNNTVLYVYFPWIDFSLYSPYDGNRELNVAYYKPSGELSYDDMIEADEVIENSSLIECKLWLDDGASDENSYVDLMLDQTGESIRFKFIKPGKGSDIDNATRILWYNEYNGISFFDFTGTRNEKRKIKTTTYEQSELDFYTKNDREKTNIYSKDLEIEVSHSTHYLEKDALYQLYSLQASRKAWIEEDGKRYYINVTALDVEEAENASHIFRATVTYTYSRQNAI